MTAGAGLSGGGTSGTIALANTGLLSLTAGTGISSTGGQSPTLSLNTAFSDARYAQVGAANIFTAPQTVNASPAATAFSASGYYGVWGSGVNGGVYGISSNNFGVVGNSGTGTGVFGTGGAYGVAGGGGSVAGVWGSQNGSGSGILGSANTAAGTAGTFNSVNGAKILSGQNSSAEVISIGRSRMEPGTASVVPCPGGLDRGVCLREAR